MNGYKHLLSVSTHIYMPVKLYTSEELLEYLNIQANLKHIKYKGFTCFTYGHKYFFNKNGNNSGPDCICLIHNNQQYSRLDNSKDKKASCYSDSDVTNEI